MFLFYYLYINCSGETGIRTPETLLTFTRFPGVHLVCVSPCMTECYETGNLNLHVICTFFGFDRLSVTTATYSISYYV